MSTTRIALIGDYDPSVTAHQAIPGALTLAGEASGVAVTFDWIHSTDLVDGKPDKLADTYRGIWAVPASPYRHRAGVLAAIRHARERQVAFLGTCGGYQHAILEYAHNVLALEHADSSEESSATEMPLVAALSCALVEQSGEIQLEPESEIAKIYNETHVNEQYHCSFGLNPAFAHLFDHGDLQISGRDAAGEVRTIELRHHPFFIGTAFQPERSSLSGRSHPLITAFVQSAGSV